MRLLQTNKILNYNRAQTHHGTRKPCRFCHIEKILSFKASTTLPSAFGNSEDSERHLAEWKLCDPAAGHRPCSGAAWRPGDTAFPAAGCPPAKGTHTLSARFPPLSRRHRCCCKGQWLGYKNMSQSPWDKASEANRLRTLKSRSTRSLR